MKGDEHFHNDAVCSESWESVEVSQNFPLLSVTLNENKVDLTEQIEHFLPNCQANKITNLISLFHVVNRGLKKAYSLDSTEDVAHLVERKPL